MIEVILHREFGTSNIRDFKFVVAIDGGKAYKIYVNPGNPRYTFKVEGGLHRKFSWRTVTQEYSEARGHKHLNASELLEIKVWDHASDCAGLISWVRMMLVDEQRWSFQGFNISRSTAHLFRAEAALSPRGNVQFLRVRWADYEGHVITVNGSYVARRRRAERRTHLKFMPYDSGMGRPKDNGFLSRLLEVAGNELEPALDEWTRFLATLDDSDA